MRLLRSDLPLANDAASRFLPWIAGLMVYLAALALAAALAVDGVAERWHVGLGGNLTVQLDAPSDGKPATRLARRDQAVALLRAEPGVEAAEPIDDAAVRRLVAPWLGTGDIGDDLPLPDLIAVKLRPGANPDVGGLGQRLAATVPGAAVDDHRQWLAGLLRLIDAVRLVAAIVLGLVVVAATATVVFVTRTGLDVHRRVIDIVHLVGATDGYIAGQFQANALTLGLLGGIGGLALAGLTLVIVAALLSGVDENLLPPLSLAPGQWALLAALPLIAALLAMLTARWTVLGSLRRTL